jgi:hypothetical protein
LSQRGRGFVPTLAMLLPLTGVVPLASNDAPITPTHTRIDDGELKNVSGSNQRISLSSDRDGNDEIYSVSPDGTGATRRRTTTSSTSLPCVVA